MVPEEKAPDAAMPFLEHLDELRARLFRCAIAFIACLAVCLYFSRPLLRFLLEPMRRHLAGGGDKRRFAVDARDRPLRVCGMVQNEGEPGGAPFWVREADGTTAVQIVEASQVAASNPQQRRVFESSTHFNPVDLVCGVRSWTGEPFDLRRFVDERAVFLSSKSHEGRELRALEQPGLWNGAMAGWNTICVEVPASTFAPVKTVFDLLRPQHQARPGA